MRYPRICAHDGSGPGLPGGWAHEGPDLPEGGATGVFF